MENLVKLLPVIAVVALVVIIFLLGYVKAPPDVAYIISGIRKRPRVLIGRAGIRIPFLERVDKLIVRQISIDIKSEGYIPTNDFIGVDVDAVAKVRVKTDPEGIQLAMKNFLNMREADFPADTANAVCFVVVVFALYQPLLMHFGGNRLDDILSLIRQANRNAVSVHQNDTNHVGAGK